MICSIRFHAVVAILVFFSCLYDGDCQAVASPDNSLLPFSFLDERPADRGRNAERFRNLLVHGDEVLRTNAGYVLVLYNDFFFPVDLHEFIETLLRDAARGVRESILSNLGDNTKLAIKHKPRLDEIAETARGEERRLVEMRLRNLKEYSIYEWAQSRTPVDKSESVDSETKAENKIPDSQLQVPREIKEIFSFLDESPMDRQVISRKFMDLVHSNDKAVRLNIPIVLTYFKDFVIEKEYEAIIEILLDDGDVNIRAEMLYCMRRAPCDMGRNAARVEELAIWSSDLDGEQARYVLQLRRESLFGVYTPQKKKSDQPQPASK